MVAQNVHHYQLIFSKQCRLALLPATECISQPMTMTVTGSNSISTTGRPKGMHMPSQTPPLLPKVCIHTEIQTNDLFYSSPHFIIHYFPHSLTHVIFPIILLTFISLYASRQHNLQLHLLIPFWVGP